MPTRCTLIMERKKYYHLLEEDTRMKKLTRRGIFNILGSHSQNDTRSSNGDSKCHCQEEKCKPSRWDCFISKMKDIKEHVVPVACAVVDMVVKVIKAFKPSPVSINYA